MKQPAWTVTCIVCGAQPGERCCSLVTGCELPKGHTRRIWSQRELNEGHAEAALCKSGLQGC